VTALALPAPKLAALEAERAVLGALIQDASPAQMLLVREALGSAAAFDLAAHQEIYLAIVELCGKGAPVDFVSLTDALAGSKALTDLGGRDYLGELVEMSLGTVEPYHLALIQDRALRRTIHVHAARAIAVAADLTTDVAEALRETVDALASTVAPITGQRAALIKQDLWPVMERIEARNRSEGLEGLPTGIRGLDDLLRGLRQGQLVILAARPSMGKTSLALHIARSAALTSAPVFVASAEMSRDELVERMLGAEAQVNLRNRPLRDQDYAHLAHAAGILSGLPLVIDDASVTTPAAIRLSAQYQGTTTQKPAQLIVVDYLQLLRGSGSNRNEEVSGISRALKVDLAKGLQVPVVALSQLSREGDKQGRSPRLSDLRDSGALEQDADVVIFLHQTPEQAQIKQVTLDVAKQRNGPTGQMQVYFDRATGAWSDWSPREDA
jgi:replicative DNA helicase